MIPRTPEDIHAAFVDAFSRADLDALIDLYEPDALLIPQPGQEAVSGHSAIRQALSGFLALKAQFVIRTESVIKSPELALLRSRWTLTARGSDGKEIQMAHRAIEVVRRQSDGRWRFVIDHPFGD